MTRLLSVNFRLVLICAWVLATTASVLVGFAAVSSVRTAIAGPGSFRLPADDAAARFPALEALLSDAGVEEAAGAVTTSTSEATTSSSALSSETAVPQSTVGSTAASPGSSQTSGAAQTSTTTTSATPATAPRQQANTYEVKGGWVTLESDSEGVHLESASPKPGWTVKVEGDGPEEVVVVFKRPEEEIHFVAKFANGQVRIEIED